MLMPLSVLMGLLCINIGVQSMSEPTELAIEEDSGILQCHGANQKVHQ